MSKESVQKKLGRVRPPRVQITYDVEVGDAIEVKELPFVLGVLGDFSAQSVQERGKIKDRKFINVDGENLDDVMRGLAPRTVMRVPNTLKNDGSEMAVTLDFQCMDDFEPQNVVKRVEPLARLLEARNRLADLRNKMLGNEKLEEILDDVLRDTESLTRLKSAGEEQA